MVDDDEPPDVNDLTLGVSTPILEHVLANNANGLLLASNGLDTGGRYSGLRY